MHSCVPPPAYARFFLSVQVKDGEDVGVLHVFEAVWPRIRTSLEFDVEKLRVHWEAKSPPVQVPLLSSAIGSSEKEEPTLRVRVSVTLLYSG
jgi:hypothetical protein